MAPQSPEASGPNRPKRRLQLGLFQKLCTLIFLFLGLILFGRGYIGYQTAMEQMWLNAQIHLTRSETIFQALTERSSQELFRAASQYYPPSINALRSAPIPRPSITSGIDSVFFITPRREIISSAQQDGSVVAPSGSQINRMLQAIALEQRPQATIICNKECFHSAYVPVITDSGDELIINLNRSVTLLLQDFYKLTGAELLLIRPALEQADAAVLASSHPDQTLPIFNAILASDPDLLSARTPFLGKTPLGYYSASINAVALSQSELLFGILTNEQTIPALAAELFRRAILLSLIMLVLAALVVYATLKPPLKRLETLTDVLPLLASGQFSQARRSLGRLTRKRGMNDEIDQLVATTSAVNNSLDTMHTDLQHHRNALEDKIHALTEAKRFNELLLDNAPMVVIVHEYDGRVHTINAQGRRLCGLDDALPIDINVNRWVYDPERQISLSQTLQSLIERTTNKLLIEFPLISSSGELLHFLWTHSLIEFDGDTLILSLGVDITEAKRAEESLHWLGEHDRVTGLLNRSTFIEKAELLIAGLGAEQNIDLILVDIDNFSEFNDRFGFDNGDRLLRAYAQHLSQHFGEDCLLARTGAGEFCVLRTSRTSAQPELHPLNPLTQLSMGVNGQPENTTATVIIERFRHDRDSIDSLLSDSTSVMNRMKARAKGHVYQADDDDGKQRREEQYRLKQQLLLALNNNRLVLFFQPIVELDSGRMTHCECLVRMLDNDGNFIPPSTFLSIANDAGLMPKLDYLVIEKAMRQQVSWRQDGVSTRLSINVTASTLDQPDFAKRIDEIIKRTGADPRSLIFELLETDALQDIDNAQRLLKQLQALGAKIALDDFGIGFTSFEYVRELPVDYIKIDKAFVQFIHERESDQVLVRSIVEMSHSLGKRVIAEGVETRQSMEVLRELDVDYIQGYYVSRPVPIDALNLKTTLPS